MISIIPEKQVNYFHINNKVISLWYCSQGLFLIMHSIVNSKEVEIYQYAGRKLKSIVKVHEDVWSCGQGKQSYFQRSRITETWLTWFKIVETEITVKSFLFSYLNLWWTNCKLLLSRVLFCIKTLAELLLPKEFLKIQEIICIQCVGNA